ncbi:MAG: trimethylamine methyltransferase family protein [Gemmobacter sp.]|nr:trimethylamine methyltransferase family protein [Gemmobacter sp.]
MVQPDWGPRGALDPVLSPLPPEGVAAVAQAALGLLANPGVEMGSPDIARALKAAGCKVSGTQVRMAPEFVTAMLARAPRSFTLTPRNPARALSVAAEGGALHFGPISSATHVWDIERGRRLADFAAFQEMIRLSQLFNALHFIGGYPVEPADIAPPERHLRCMAEMLRLTDKVVHAYALDVGQAEEAMELVRLASGLSPSEFAASPRMFTNMNPVTPLRQDGAVLEAALRFAQNGQAVCVTPFAVIGAPGTQPGLAPKRLAGAVALALAEGLAALAALQWLAPGAPVLLGALLPVADARSGAPVYAGPEPARAMQMMGQMARHFGLPFRASGGCTAAIPDGQAMWEMTQSLASAQQSGAAMVYHAAGWLEGGLTASREKLVMDVEVLQQMAQQADPALIATDAAALAMEAPALPASRGMLSDLRAYEGWQADGALWTSERANRMIPRLLEAAVDPSLPDSAEEALARFVSDACAV